MWNRGKLKKSKPWPCNRYVFQGGNAAIELQKTKAWCYNHIFWHEVNATTGRRITAITSGMREILSNCKKPSHSGISGTSGMGELLLRNCKGQSHRSMTVTSGME
jgi:hypothetical protein